MDPRCTECGEKDRSLGKFRRTPPVVEPGIRAVLIAECMNKIAVRISEFIVWADFMRNV